MEDIQYLGENLWPGRIGHAGIILAFTAALSGAISYFFAVQKAALPEEATWRRMGRFSFLAHGIGVFTVIGAIFYAMIEQRYEYQYVWAHVSDDLPMKYIFSAFWEGQEGSFLLWMFWHVVLGFLLMFSTGKWEAPVLAVLLAIEWCIACMILGVYFGDLKIGTNPTLLLRDTMEAPIFANADYLQLIKGNGLNPLLQNWWMTIHPPTLFLGFASTAVPFAFVVAGLWKKDYQGWLKPALPWALFSGMILGTGILMGGAWAYEALSFGGYWAWDPVENLSLVPWLLLVAGVHTNLVARSTGYSVRSTMLFYLLTFSLILYSTFMTRSGILGESSVHSFTEMGLGWQLTTFVLLFFLGSLALWLVHYRRIQEPKPEESMTSKEFWIFFGSLILAFSALLITFSTSLPVFNKIIQYFNPAFQGRVITDPVAHYNNSQLYIGIAMGLFSGGVQFLRWREGQWAIYRKKFLVHIGISAALAGLFSWLTTLWINASAWQYLLLLFSGWFTLLANLDYLITFLRGNLKLGGSVLSHVGFGLLLVGILASGLNKRFISVNRFVMDGLIEGADSERLKNNILLFKGVPLPMSGYEVTYQSDTMDNLTRTYRVNFMRRDSTGKELENFDLFPNILYDKSFTKIAASNPDTRQYLHKDIFSHIASLPQVEMDMEFRKQREDSLVYKPFLIPQGRTVYFTDTVPITDQDTFVLKSWQLTLDSITRTPTHPEYKPQQGDLAVGAYIRVKREDDDSTYTAQPVVILRGQLVYYYPSQLNELSTRVRLHPDILDAVFTPESELQYQDFTAAIGQTISFKGLQLRFDGFNPKATHPSLKAKEGDLVVGAKMTVLDGKGGSWPAEPIFFIRDNAPSQIKAEVDPVGLHLRFVSIAPAQETIHLKVAQKLRPTMEAPVEIATNALRSDYIVLEAIEFPGINLVWLGSTFMVLGLGLSMTWRIAQKRRTEA